MSGRRVSLPLHGKLLDLIAPPTIEAMRSRLGGRAATNEAEALPARASVGDLVQAGAGDPPRVGVVLAADALAIDVFTGGTVRRTRGAEVKPWLGAIPGDLATVAARIRAFGALAEGDAVRFTRDDAHAVAELGVVVEKCRWGALVHVGEGKVLGVGFQRLTAAPLDAPGD